MPRPRYPLVTVQALAAADNFVAGFHRAERCFQDVAAARHAIREALSVVTEANFANTVLMASGPFDVYGIRRATGGWYL